MTSEVSSPLKYFSSLRIPRVQSPRVHASLVFCPDSGRGVKEIQQRCPLQLGDGKVPNFEISSFLASHFSHLLTLLRPEKRHEMCRAISPLQGCGLLDGHTTWSTETSNFPKRRRSRTWYVGGHLSIILHPAPANHTQKALRVKMFQLWPCQSTKGGSNT